MVLPLSAALSLDEELDELTTDEELSIEEELTTDEELTTEDELSIEEELTTDEELSIEEELSMDDELSMEEELTTEDELLLTGGVLGSLSEQACNVSSALDIKIAFNVLPLGKNANSRFIEYSSNGPSMGQLVMNQYQSCYLVAWRA